MPRIHLLTCTLVLLAGCVPILIPIPMPAPDRRQSIEPADISALESQLHARVSAYRIDRNLSGWISSSGHEENLTGDYDLTGVGIARRADGTYFVTQIYADGG